MASRLKERYESDIRPALVREFNYTSPMQAPRLNKVVVNVGVGEAISNAKALEAVTKDIATVTGQKPVTTKSKKSIANFKLRAGMPIGVMVTLRGERMYEFVDKLISIALPRVRDFQGVSANSFDGRGNYSIGLKEQLVFPEIDYDSIDKLRGLQVTIATTAHNDEEARRLLQLMGMPFRS
jgi:large subunit ribosomal protein L5